MAWRLQGWSLWVMPLWFFPPSAERSPAAKGGMYTDISANAPATRAGGVRSEPVPVATAVDAVEEHAQTVPYLGQRGDFLLEFGELARDDRSAPRAPVRLDVLVEAGQERVEVLGGEAEREQ